uniref:(California timema) hypothetical protein n=1 Tax=Timema californicum TaxID=61474 RepID=A0A7R9J4A3_TIMCA|nr:unnamed protein product [Timema californicum]
MPSASTAKLEKQASTEAVDPLRQAIVVIDHKIRNLVKRKRKIEQYEAEQKSGKNLNSDQLLAVSKKDEVMQTLEFARDLSKSFNILALDTAKAQKKQARKEALERNQQDIAKVKEILLVQLADTLVVFSSTAEDEEIEDILANMGQDNVREDFLAGQNGAVQLTEEELKYLDDLYGEVSPKRIAEEGSPPFQLANALVVLSLTAEDGEIEVRISLEATEVEQVQEPAVEEEVYVEKETTVVSQETATFLQGTLKSTYQSHYLNTLHSKSFSSLSPSVTYLNPDFTVLSSPHGPLLRVSAVPSSGTPSNQTPRCDADGSTIPTVPLEVQPVVSMLVQQQQAVPISTPVATSEGSYFSTAAATFVPGQMQQTQRSIPEFISSVTDGSIHFLQDSELDPPDISVMLTGSVTQQRVGPTPPPAPIPSQTFTNQSFASVSTASGPQQLLPTIAKSATFRSDQLCLLSLKVPHSDLIGSALVVYQPSNEIPQSHIPAFVSPTMNPPPPIPMPPSHRSVSPTAPLQQSYGGQVPTYASQAQQQTIPYGLQQQPQTLAGYENIQQQNIPDPSEHQQIPEQTTSVPIEVAADDWSKTETEASDWNAAADSQGDWNTATDNQGDWNTENQDWCKPTESNNDWSTASSGQGDGYITQGSRNYGGGRGRSNRGGGSRGGTGYSGGRGRGSYQNDRGNGGYQNDRSSYNYRERSEGGGGNYYQQQNGYQQRDNYGNSNYRGGSGGYKRGGPREGSGQRGGMDRGAFQSRGYPKSLIDIQISRALFGDDYDPPNRVQEEGQVLGVATQEELEEAAGVATLEETSSS